MKTYRYENVKTGSHAVLPIAVYDRAGTAIPLVSASCRVSIRSKRGGQVIINAVSVVAGDDDHEVSYTWNLDGVEVGDYEVEFYVVDGDGTQTYLPSIAITVEQKIGA